MRRWRAGSAFGFTGWLGLAVIVFWAAAAIFSRRCCRRRRVGGAKCSRHGAAHWFGTDYLGATC
jgi:peptide/nickel transport system permease protein